jgi:hypothetical protein
VVLLLLLGLFVAGHRQTLHLLRRAGDRATEVGLKLRKRIRG